MDTLDSFVVATKAKQATALSVGYKVQGTPSIGVDGRWLTSGSMAGSNERSLAVAEHLIGVAKKKRLSGSPVQCRRKH
jgi:thiol:disulfide interchange protein DsbA